jgi:hypothetical protein
VDRAGPSASGFRSERVAGAVAAEMKAPEGERLAEASKRWGGCRRSNGAVALRCKRDRRPFRHLFGQLSKARLSHDCRTCSRTATPVCRNVASLYRATMRKVSEST